MSYENPWRYNGEIFESEQIGSYYGFVYHIRNTVNQKCYIGRKYFVSFTKDKVKTRRSKKESDWKKYYGSCPELKEDVKKYGKESFERTILSVHRRMGEVNYEETKQLFLNNVLMERLDNGSPAYYNSNILGRYMRKDYENFGRDPSTIT